MGAPVLSDPRLRGEVLGRISRRRIGQPSEIGPPAVFLASNESDMITGEVMFIDAGANAV